MNEQIRTLETQMQDLKQRLEEARRAAYPRPVDDYAFLSPDGRPVRLSSLFGDKADLLVIHNMGRRCSYCTMWADGINGLRQHIENRTALALCSPDEPAVLREFAAGRGWGMQLVSSAESNFHQAMGFAEAGKPGVWPGVSAFHKGTDGGIVRTGSATFGPGDDFCAVWPLLALLRKGANGWEPRFSYQ
jgi:predicted dithiol-disulfide oxidoreductase (DUF899 family)